MPKFSGRDCVIKKAAVTIGGARTVGIKKNGTPINIEDQGNNGVARYLADVLTGQSIELTMSGLEEDQVLRTIAMASTAAGSFLDDLTFEYPNGAILSGDFVMTSYDETGQYESAQEYNATFASDGVWTFTPPA